MSELKWNWAYLPYLDPPEGQKESALKAGYIKVVDKSEADKVITGKDAEIAQLQAMLEERNKQVGELKAERDWLAKDRAQAYDDLEKRAQLNIKQEESIRHHKYKRCVAMAYVEWLKQMTLCYYPESILYRRAYRRERKWKELAEKFKPNNSTAQ